ncbi:MAG: MoxR family ATPase [Oscillospiraceae bacterium]|nr:MoxR family ATPase [Oscillospiraceae bacterium]
MDNNTLNSLYHKTKLIGDEIEKVIVGKRGAVDMMVLALLAGGHVLIEDVPGVGKTTLATSLGKATGLNCKRAQFTPDVMASDITGFTVYNKEKNEFEYKNGYVMCNILLADEVNRTSPKTQSALLEAMEERRVSVDNETYKLPNPFMVIATQNETGFVGTFPLPEAQLDRFLIKISIGYPSLYDEIEIIKNRQNENPIDNVRPVCSRDEILKIVSLVRDINIEDAICRYIVELVALTREHPLIELGGSPRACIMLMRASQAKAFLAGRLYVTPEDVAEMLFPVLGHRLQLTQDAKVKRRFAADILSALLRKVNPPYKRS